MRVEEGDTTTPCGSGPIGVGSPCDECGTRLMRRIAEPGIWLCLPCLRSAVRMLEAIEKEHGG